MLDRNTVLILGAGASNHYGYPLGTELKSSIIQNLIIGSNEYERINSPYIIPKVEENDRIDNVYTLYRYLRHAGVDLNIVQSFLKDFMSSPKYSIDAFLENRPEFLQVGKTLIAYSIFKNEVWGTLFSNRQNDWYRYLFNAVVSSRTALETGKLSIITYNYDRSFETFFTDSLISTFGITAKEALEIFGNVHIVHLHGKLVEEAWQIGGKAYTPEIIARDLNEAIEDLHIISEEPQLQSSYHKAHEIMQDADQIFILGFGYEERNLARLQLDRLNNIPIYGCRMGVTDLELQRINEISGGCIRFGTDEHRGIVDFFKYDASLFGHEHWNLETFNKAVGSKNYARPVHRDRIQLD